MNNRAITILNLGLRDKLGIYQIKDSIKILQEALRAVSPKTEPILWGTSQLNLGVAFSLLAQRQPEGGPLDKALLAYRSALSEWSRDQVPRLWVKAQLNIGRALTRLGELNIESDYLKEAEETFNAALESCPRESSPLSWARINTSLGVVLTRMAERELGFQTPLPVIPVSAPGTTDWVARQQTLALNLGLSQRREVGLNCLERAVTAFRNSLGELPRDRLPVDWADTQHNFSLALVRLGEQEEDTEYLYQALAAVNFALEEWTFESFPFDWAIAQNTLAGVLIRLGERETETRILRFESAVAACRKSFQLQRQDTSPFQWALTQNTLGLALHGLGEAQNDIVKLTEAASAYSSALEVFRAISAAKHIAYLENNLRIVQVLIEGHRNTVGQEVRR